MPALPGWLVAVVTVGGLSFVAIGQPGPAVAYLVTYLAVITLAQSRMAWAERLPGSPVVRMSIRVGIFVVPMLALGLPSMAWSWPFALFACALSGVGILAQRDDIRGAFRPELLALFAFPTRSAKNADLMCFTLGGAAQEYLHRGVGLMALHSIGPLAIVVTAVLFVVEHLVQPRAMATWDRHDIVVHSVLGLVLGAISWIVGGPLIAIVAHTLYNSPNIARTALTPVQSSRTGAHA